MSGGLRLVLDNLCRMLEEETPAGHASVPFITALRDGHFYFERETWHDLDALSPKSLHNCPAELLLRVRDENGRPVPPQDPVADIDSLGLTSAFDLFVTLSAIHETLNIGETFPISINLSIQSINDHGFLPLVNKALEMFFRDQIVPEQIIFELREDSDGQQASIDSIEFMRQHGYRIALDDVSHHPDDKTRIETLGPYADFLKIDGKTLCAARAGETDLDAFISLLRNVAPNAKILVEWVDSKAEACALHDSLGVGYAQGRDLPKTSGDFWEGHGSGPKPP